MHDDSIIFACDTSRTVIYMEDPDKRKVRLSAVLQEAKRSGLCPISLIIGNDLIVEAGLELGDVPSATSKEGEMARMVVLANYAQREYAVRVMEGMGFKNYAEQLAQQPDIVHRDGLPPAQLILSEMLEQVQRQSFSEGYDEGQRARFRTAGAVLRGLRAAFSELDGYVPNVPVIMTRFTHLFAIADSKIDKDALWNKLCTAA